MEIRRVAAVTAGLATAGALVGGVAGVVWAAFYLSRSVVDGAAVSSVPRLFAVAGGIGALMGAVLGPPAAWLLMRHVPLGIALGVTALGTLAGSVAGMVFTSRAYAEYPLLGFAVSVVALRLLVRPGRPAVAAGEAPARPAGGGSN